MFQATAELQEVNISHPQEILISTLFIQQSSIHSPFSSLLLLVTAALAAAQTIKLESFPNTVKLTEDFDPVKEAYWTGLPHHRRTPFSISPDGSRGYLAYLDGSGEGVHVGVKAATSKPLG